MRVAVVLAEEVAQLARGGLDVGLLLAGLARDLGEEGLGLREAAVGRVRVGLGARADGGNRVLRVEDGGHAALLVDVDLGDRDVPSEEGAATGTLHVGPAARRRCSGARMRTRAPNWVRRCSSTTKAARSGVMIRDYRKTPQGVNRRVSRREAPTLRSRRPVVTSSTESGRFRAESGGLGAC